MSSADYFRRSRRVVDKFLGSIGKPAIAGFFIGWACLQWRHERVNWRFRRCLPGENTQQILVTGRSM
jgi:hypothetical protein